MWFRWENKHFTGCQKKNVRYWTSVVWKTYFNECAVRVAIVINKLSCDKNISNNSILSFSRSGTRFWNSLPKSVKNSPKFSFKKKIRNTLFSMLQQEERYFEFERVTKVFAKYCSSCWILIWLCLTTESNYPIQLLNLNELEIPFTVCFIDLSVILFCS